VQLGGVKGKDMAWPRSYGGYKARLPREAELARPNGGRIAERVSQMPDWSSEPPLKERLALGDLAHGGCCIALR
jgi:hypothetical protein